MMVQKIAGAVVIITGASSGIGAAIAQELGHRGARLVLAARREAELAAVAESIVASSAKLPEKPLIVPTDVSDKTQITRLIERTIETYGHIDVLINNAGIAVASVEKASDTEVQQLFDVNLIAPIMMIRAVLPGMLERHHGAIISVASVAGHVAVDTLYSASKFGLRGFSVSLNRRLKRTGVTASVISPGFVRTSFTAGRSARLPGPEIVARAIARLIEHPRREVIVPWYYRIPIWAEEAVPWLLDRVLTGNRIM